MCEELNDSTETIEFKDLTVKEAVKEIKKYANKKDSFWMEDLNLNSTWSVTGG